MGNTFYKTYSALDFLKLQSLSKQDDEKAKVMYESLLTANFEGNTFLSLVSEDHDKLNNVVEATQLLEQNAQEKEANHKRIRSRFNMFNL